MYKYKNKLTVKKGMKRFVARRSRIIRNNTDVDGGLIKCEAYDQITINSGATSPIFFLTGLGFFSVFFCTCAVFTLDVQLVVYLYIVVWRCRTCSNRTSCLTGWCLSSVVSVVYVVSVVCCLVCFFVLWCLDC